MREETKSGIPKIPEVPKTPRKNIMAILLVVIVGLTAVSGFIWWHSQKGEEAPATPSPEFSTYSKYGFTFEYPKGMSISEKGIGESNSSGTVVCELKYSEFIMVIWFTTVNAPDMEDLEDSLNAGFEYWEEGVVVGRGQLVNSTKSGHTMIYQYFNVASEGMTLHGIYGCWYCDTNNRLYGLINVYSEQDVLPKFQQYVGSFICH